MSINSHCIYFNTPIGGWGCSSHCFVLLGLIQKFNSTINYFDNKTILHSNNPTTTPKHDNPTFPNQYIRSIILVPHKPHLPPFVIHLANCTRPPLNRLKSTHTSPYHYTNTIYTYTYYIYDTILYYINVYLYTSLVYLCIHMIFTCISFVLQSLPFLNTLFIIWYKFQ